MDMQVCVFFCNKDGQKLPLSLSFRYKSLETQNQEYNLETRTQNEDFSQVFSFLRDSECSAPCERGDLWRINWHTTKDRGHNFHNRSSSFLRTQTLHTRESNFQAQKRTLTCVCVCFFLTCLCRMMMAKQTLLPCIFLYLTQSCPSQG